jgi:hypothetical protein
VDARDDRLGALVHQPEHARELARVLEVALEVEVDGFFHPVQVAPRAEGRSRAREHDEPDLRSGRFLLEDPRELRDHHLVEGISDIGAVDRDGEHPSRITFDLQGLVAGGHF